ncbi:hypothetical protein KP509_31G058700 [Ceratopteris richardii]|uniref:Uncharacterized protein n=1 Tax=Ceratopteris richardii TaxID=49495 RepID=A0A8T2R0A9_CERRI|nr:hypothetical protein KP509_31G058700 [Ceratopteris richardii]
MTPLLRHSGRAPEERASCHTRRSGVATTCLKDFKKSLVWPSGPELFHLGRASITSIISFSEMLASNREFMFCGILDRATLEMVAMQSRLSGERGVETPRRWVKCLTMIDSVSLSISHSFLFMSFYYKGSLPFFYSKCKGSLPLILYSELKDQSSTLVSV